MDQLKKSFDTTEKSALKLVKIDKKRYILSQWRFSYPKLRKFTSVPHLPHRSKILQLDEFFLPAVSSLVVNKTLSKLTIALILKHWLVLSADVR